MNRLQSFPHNNSKIKVIYVYVILLEFFNLRIVNLLAVIGNFQFKVFVNILASFVNILAINILNFVAFIGNFQIKDNFINTLADFVKTLTHHHIFDQAFIGNFQLKVNFEDRVLNPFLKIFIINLRFEI